jgi:phosphohistidine phosphatase SixA
MKSKIAFVFLLPLLFSCHPNPDTEVEKQKENSKSTIVYLVRHAEKVDQSEDPNLSEAGKERSLELSKVLKDVALVQIFSTNYKRTKETANPTAESKKITVELYDPSKLEDFAKKLKDLGGKHLVVGHSNTTPELVKLLGGEPGTAIDEATEYDRLYILTITKQGDLFTELLRYGK